VTANRSGTTDDRMADIGENDPGSSASRRKAGHAASLPGFWRAWARFELGAGVPASRWCPWGGAVAAVALVGIAASVLQLLIGLWAVGLCQRRGRAVEDPEVVGLLAELRAAMGCRREVALREVPDLATPATAGWWRPVLLLPDDWRSWDEPARQAVLAHELAHIIRRDYVSALLARIAVALNFYHPLVRWMAGRLQLQQELAADAQGARFAGGRARYLVALSSLALKQDGRSRCWPARGFLPGRRALIRRIAMLCKEDGKSASVRPWSRRSRLLSAGALTALAIVAATFRAPVLGEEDGVSAADGKRAPVATTRAGEPTFGPLYVPEDAAGMVVIRPGAALRHKGMAWLCSPLLSYFVGVDASEFLADFPALLPKPKHEPARQDLIKLDCKQLDWAACGFSFGRSKGADGKELHTLRFAAPTVRMLAPFDWLAFLRQWRLEFAEIREAGHVYYKMTGPVARLLGPDGCVYLPDDRTIVLDREKSIRKLAAGESRPLPAFLRGPDWECARKGLIAIALNTQDPVLVKEYDLGRPDDALILPLFKDVDHWTLSVADADAMVVRAAAVCRDRAVSEVLTRTIESLVKMGKGSLEQELADPEVHVVDAHVRATRMAKALLANLRTERAGRSVAVYTDGFGTFADLAAIVEAELKCECKARNKKAVSEAKTATKWSG